jgi:hypothetical protein
MMSKDAIEIFSVLEVFENLAEQPVIELNELSLSFISGGSHSVSF